MKALGLVDLDKKIFENCILKTYFLIPWPTCTYATNWNGLNTFGRGTPRDHSCEVWSKSNERFQRRSCLKKLLTNTRTDGCTDDGRRTMGHYKIISTTQETVWCHSLCWCSWSFKTMFIFKIMSYIFSLIVDLKNKNMKLFYDIKRSKVYVCNDDFQIWYSKQHGFVLEL